MRLSSVCVLVSAVWAVIGLVPGVWMQAELWAPGIQFGDARYATGIYLLANGLHAPVFSIALPLTLVAALGTALFAERGDGGLWRAICVTYLVIAGLAVLGAALSPSSGTEGILRDMASFAVISSAILGVILATMSAEQTRLSIILFCICGVLALLVAGALSAALANIGEDAVLADTAVVSARAHAVGVALVLWGVGVLTVLAGRSRVRTSSGISLLLAVLMLGGGMIMVIGQASAGMQGMPRGYADYPAAFAPMHQVAGFGAVLFLVATGLALVRLFVILRAPRVQLPDAFA